MKHFCDKCKHKNYLIECTAGGEVDYVTGIRKVTGSSRQRNADGECKLYKGSSIITWFIQLLEMIE